MMCERCRERPARYVIKHSINGQTVGEQNLCERCAAEHGDLAVLPGAEAQLSVQQLLAGLLGAAAETAGGTAQTGAAVPPGLSCPRCGHTYLEFARTGLLGCPECYEAFSAQLQPVIRRVHGKTRHEGKIPARGGARVRRRQQRDALRRELAEAITREEFEQAAALRDRIREMDAAGDASR